MIVRVVCAMLCTALVAAAEGVSTAPPGHLPSPDAILDKVLKATEKEDANEKAFREKYAWYRVRVIQELNGKGEVTKTNRTKKDFYPSRRTAVSTQATQTATNQPNYEEKDFVITKDLLSRFTFTTAARETLNGRSTLILDFQPANRKLPVNGLKDKFINNAEGRLWIDEEDSLIIQASIRLRDQVNIAGGIAGAVKFFQYNFERVRTADGLWYVAKANWKLEAREFLVQKRLACEEHKENVLRIRKTSAR
jgi:hypothetical protein